MKNLKKVKDSINQIGFISIGSLFGYSVAVMTGSESGPIFESVAVGVAAGLISIFIDFIIQPNQIFGFWSTKVLEWLKKDRNLLRVFAKPLGACLYCMNVWVTLVVFIYANRFLNFEWPVFFAIVAISHVSVAIIERKINE
jgi:hypothetical protein